MQPSLAEDSRIYSLLVRLAHTGLENAAVGLSEMIGHKVTMTVPHVTLAPVATVAERIGGPEAQVVGIYLAAEGDITGHIMLILGIQDAAELIDLLLGESPSSDQLLDLDPLARSALAEAGNITASFFLNAVSTLLDRSARPSPPAVIIDMAGAILDILVCAAGEFGDEVVLVESEFEGQGKTLQIVFWVLPDLEPLRTLVYEPA